MPRLGFSSSRSSSAQVLTELVLRDAQPSVLAKAAPVFGVCQIGDCGDHRGLSSEKSALRMIMEGQEFRHRCGHGSQPEIDFAM